MNWKNPINFEVIKTAGYEALQAELLSPSEQQSLRAVVLADSNPQRAQLFAKVLGLSL